MNKIGFSYLEGGCMFYIPWRMQYAELTHKAGTVICLIKKQDQLRFFENISNTTEENTKVKLLRHHL